MEHVYAPPGRAMPVSARPGTSMHRALAADPSVWYAGGAEVTNTDTLQKDKALSSLPPADIRLLAVDLDGTLLTNDKRITPRTARALDSAMAAGILVVPVTGRPLSGLLYIQLGVYFDLCTLSDARSVYDKLLLIAAAAMLVVTEYLLLRNMKPKAESA